MEPIELTTVSTPDEVRDILELQARNLPLALTPETMANQGFVTVRHDASVLQRMNEAAPSIVAKAAGRVVGYALVMPPSFAADVPILGPLFETLKLLSWQGAPLLDDPRWLVMGQICIAERYRGIGVFDRLYARVGFEPLHVYPDATTGEEWHVIGLELTRPAT